MNVIRLSDRIARLEAQRRGAVPDRQRLAEANGAPDRGGRRDGRPRSAPGLPRRDRGGQAALERYGGDPAAAIAAGDPVMLALVAVARLRGGGAEVDRRRGGW